MDTRDRVANPKTKPQPNSANTQQPFTVHTADLDYLADLHSAANILLQNGRAVIPLWGDLQEGDFAKAPPIKTKRYQDELPSMVDTREWFMNCGYMALGVMCGRVSGNLRVIDFDAPEWLARFQAAFPDLLDTYTVVSGGRKLPHYWYIAPHSEDLKFRGRAGAAEFRGEGQYVIVPPTRIHGGSYAVTCGGEPKHLTTEQYNRVLAWFDNHFGAPHEDTTEYETIPAGDAKHLTEAFTKQLGKLKSRNRAAFVTLGWARDNEWTKAAARAALRAAFVHCLHIGTHSKQTAAARGKEFDATLNSVYSRQPRQRLASGIPTLLREHLLQHELIGLARVLDCLVMSGWVAGQAFTEADAVRQCGQHGLSRALVHAVLQVTVENIKPVFVPSETPNLDVTRVPSNSPALVFNAKDTRHSEYIQIRGKAVRLFHMPDAIGLCVMLGIATLFSDALPFTALATIGDYRTAITRALIQRKPGQYKQQLLAKRVGVKPRRIRYIIQREKTIKATPRYQETIVTTDNLKSLISEERADMGGYCLDIEGKRFPPVREIAEHKLTKGYTVKLVKREANHYQVEAAESVQDPPTAESAEAGTIPQAEAVYAAEPDVLIHELEKLGGVLAGEPFQPRVVEYSQHERGR